MRAFRVGLIGCGYMGGEWAEALGHHPNFRLHSVVAQRMTSAISFASKYDAKAYLDAQSLVEIDDLDVLLVAVPELQLETVVRQISGFQGVVLFEKPFGLNPTESRHLARLAGALEQRSFVSLNRRFYSTTRAALGILQQSNGRRRIEVTDQQSRLSARASGQPLEVVSAWHYANSIHLIDLIRFIGRGEIESVTSRTTSLDNRVSVVSAEVVFSSGDSASYAGVWESSGVWAVRAAAPQVWVELSPLETGRIRRGQSREFESLEISEHDSRFKPGLWNQLDELERQLTLERSSLVSLNDAILSMDLVSRIYGE